MGILRRSFLVGLVAAGLCLATYLLLMATGCLAQTKIDSQQIQFSKPITVPGPLTVKESDFTDGGWEFSPVSSPKLPAAGDLLLFLNKNTGHLSVMDPAGNIRDLMPNIVNQGAVP